MTEPFVVAYNAGDAATLTGGSWDPLFPLSNLQTRDVSTFAKAAWVSPSSTCFRASWGGPVTARVVALINHNLVGPASPDVHTDPTTLPRFRVRTIHGLAGFASFAPKAKPDTIVGSPVNLSGSVAALQDPDPEHADGSWMTAISPTASTEVWVALESSDCGLRTGAGLQTVRYRVRKTSGATAPTVTPKIYLSGVLKLTGSPVTVSSTTGTLLTFTFDASVLGGSPPPATGLELRLNGTASANATVEFGAIEFLPEFASNAAATVTDSGWVDQVLPAGYWTPPRRFQNLYLFYDLGASTSVDQVFVELNATGQADGFIQAGRLVIGDAVFFYDPTSSVVSPEVGIKIRRVDSSIKQRINGHLAIDKKRTWREMVFSYPVLSRASAIDTVLDLLDGYGGTTESMLWVTAPGEDSRIHDTLLWGPQKELQDLDGIPTSPQGFSRTLLIEEDA